MGWKRPIETDRWYVPADLSKHQWSPRWTLKLYKGGDGRERVLYSDGCDHYSCLRETFSKWIGSAKAEIADGTARGRLETEQGEKESKAGTQQTLQPITTV
jgi:hypothetical protein